jgi:hypothetical protein
MYTNVTILCHELQNVICKKYGISIKKCYLNTVFNINLRTQQKETGVLPNKPDIIFTSVHSVKVLAHLLEVDLC